MTAEPAAARRTQGVIHRESAVPSRGVLATMGGLLGGFGQPPGPHAAGRARRLPLARATRRHILREPENGSAETNSESLHREGARRWGMPRGEDSSLSPEDQRQRSTAPLDISARHWREATSGSRPRSRCTAELRRDDAHSGASLDDEPSATTARPRHAWYWPDEPNLLRIKENHHADPVPSLHEPATRRVFW